MKPIQLTAYLSAMFAAVIPLVACSDKPPGCADDETRQTMKELIVNEAKKIAPGSADDPTGIINKFMQGVQVELSSIVDDGYQAAAQKRSCKATMKVSVPNGQPLEGDVAWTVQRTVDDRSKFVLELMPADQFSSQLADAAQASYTFNRFAGSYRGTFSCTGIAWVAESPKSPLSVAVSMTVAPGQPSVANLEVPGPDGAPEMLSGTAGSDFQLAGRGQLGPMRTTTELHGTINRDTVNGTGFVRAAENFGILQNCKLELTREAALGLPGPSNHVIAAASAIGEESSHADSHGSADAGTSRPRASTAFDFPGNYAGVGEGNISVEIGTIDANGSYPVTMTTSAQSSGGDGCGGALKGHGRLAVSTMTVSSDDYGHCEVSMKQDSTGKLQIDEGGGCAAYHGGACSFDGTVTKH